MAFRKKTSQSDTSSVSSNHLRASSMVYTILHQIPNPVLVVEKMSSSPMITIFTPNPLFGEKVEFLVSNGFIKSYTKL